MFTEDDLLPISGLQHLVFCERQWALIHLEQVWEENRLTTEGKHLHERVDEPETESRVDVRTARALSIRSLRLGLSGRADVVEFHRAPTSAAIPVHSTGAETQAAPFPISQGSPGVLSNLELSTQNSELSHVVVLPGAPGLWTVFPVEYKRGKPKPDRCDEVQLCAQALCLEEMLSASIPAGALFYGQPRRRTDVPFTADLRAYTTSLAARLHDLTARRETPAAVYAKKCDNCSLIVRCLPKRLASRPSADRYLACALQEAVMPSAPESLSP